MDLLQNKKALMGIVAGVVVVLLAVFAAMTMTGGGSDGSGDATSAPATTAAAGTTSPGGPSSKGASYPTGGDAASAPAAVTADAAGVKALPPAERSLADPFAPLSPPPSSNPKVLAKLQMERDVAALPPLTIYNPRPTASAEDLKISLGGNGVTGADTTGQNAPDVSTRRVAGIVVGKNAYAILEVDGQTAVVKPGDVLPDFTRVERIERDKVLLRKGTRAITVPLASNPSLSAGGGGGPATGGAGGGGRYGGNYNPYQRGAGSGGASYGARGG